MQVQSPHRGLALPPQAQSTEISAAAEAAGVSKPEVLVGGRARACAWKRLQRLGHALPHFLPSPGPALALPKGPMQCSWKPVGTVLPAPVPRGAARSPHKASETCSSLSVPPPPEERRGQERRGALAALFTFGVSAVYVIIQEPLATARTPPLSTINGIQVVY